MAFCVFNINFMKQTSLPVPASASEAVAASVDQLVDLRSLYRVTEQIIIIDQAVKEEHGKRNCNNAENKTSQCFTRIFLSGTDVRIFSHNGKYNTDHSADQSHRSVFSAYKGKGQIKKAADNTCNAADQGTGCQLF